MSRLLAVVLAVVFAFGFLSTAAEAHGPRFVNSGVRFRSFDSNRGSFRSFEVRSANGFRFNSFGRFNSFDSRTFVDANGNVFEQDRFGNLVFRGNAFGRGFSGRNFRSSGFNGGGNSINVFIDD